MSICNSACMSYFTLRISNVIYYVALCLYVVAVVSCIHAVLHKYEV